MKSLIWIVLAVLVVLIGQRVVVVYSEEGYLEGNHQESPFEKEVSKGRMAELIKNLGDDDPKIRENATEELVTMGESCLDSLRRVLLESKDPEVKIRAKLIIGRIERLLRVRNLPEIWGEDVYYRLQMKGENYGYVRCGTVIAEYENTKALKFCDKFLLREADGFIAGEMVTFCRLDEILSIICGKLKIGNRTVWEFEFDKGKMIHWWENRDKKSETLISEGELSVTIATAFRLITTLSFEDMNVGFEMISLGRRFLPGGETEPLVDISVIEFKGREDVLINGITVSAHKFFVGPPGGMVRTWTMWLDEEHKILRVSSPGGQKAFLASKEEVEEWLIQVKKQLSDDGKDE